MTAPGFTPPAGPADPGPVRWPRVEVPGHDSDDRPELQLVDTPTEAPRDRPAGPYWTGMGWACAWCGAPCGDAAVFERHLCPARKAARS